VQLNFRLMTVPNSGLTSMTISESGDFTLFGGGTALTQVAAGIGIQVDILAVDGIPLAVPLNLFDSTSFVADLLNDGPVQNAHWGNNLLIDFAAALNNANIPFNLGVTKAEVVIDDQLLAISEATSIAIIAKKDFKIGQEFQKVPEPTSLAMMMLAIAGYGFALRRRIVRSIRRRFH
jgi:PEP-CTERM motif